MTIKTGLCVLALAASPLFAACTEHVSPDTPDEKEATTVQNSQEYDWKPFVPDNELDGYLLGRERVFWDEDLRNSDFSGENLLGYTFCEVDLRNVTFKGLQNDWDFSGQDLTRARFLGFRSSLVTSLPQADITDAIVTDIGLELTLEQFKSTWNYRNGYLRGVYLEQYRDEWEKELREKSAGEGADEEACSPVFH